jgi:uncharacterized protein (DUF2132 family)
MDMKELHAKYKDENSPSVEGQVRWLQKQGFAQHQIEQAMIAVYTEIERGEKDFKDGLELDQYLLEKAKIIRTQELADQVKKMESFVESIRNKAIEDYKKQQARPWYKKILGMK